MDMGTGEKHLSYTAIYSGLVTLILNLSAAAHQ
jgi:hypothetical protein